jgi:WbqC-like protein family
MAERLVAIHQPNFLPWLGYFDKVARADVFVFLDDAQQQKKGGSYTNRVRMLVGGEPAWMTVPIDRSYHGVREIREIEIDESKPWRRKALATIEQSYGRAPHFDEVFPLVGELIELRDLGLAEYNLRAVRELCDRIGLEAEFALSSELGVDAGATERLIELTRAAGGTAYLSGGGAEGYQEDEAFAAAGVGLVMQEFRHPRYEQQADEFTEGLSVVDALMSRGPAGVRELLAG